MRTKIFMALNTGLSMTGIGIQLSILYPWHPEVNAEILALQKQQENMSLRLKSSTERLAIQKQQYEQQHHEIPPLSAVVCTSQKKD